MKTISEKDIPKYRAQAIQPIIIEDTDYWRETERLFLPLLDKIEQRKKERDSA